MPGEHILNDAQLHDRSRHQIVGLILGPLLAIAMLLSDPPQGLSQAGWSSAAIGILMAVWWATEAVPIAVTALLPIVVFPLLGVATIHDATAPYANKVIYLFLGGFIVAFAMQRWNLHRRIALWVLQHVGGNGRSLVGGFMLASAAVSMWVMNTSTTMMMLPIAVSIIGVIHGTVGDLDDEGRKNFQYSLLLGVAYGATIGGMATLVGTAPNAIMVVTEVSTTAAPVVENTARRSPSACRNRCRRWMPSSIPIATRGRGPLKRDTAPPPR